MNDWRNARIEEAAKLIGDAEIIPYVDGGVIAEPESLAAQILAVFEKALGEATVTPSDDEREKRALERYEAALGTGLSDHEAREEGWPTRHGKLGTLSCHAGCVTECSEVPEPSADDSMSHYTDPTDPFWQPHPEPQGKPSDAQVNAALNAHRLSDLLNSGYGAERFHEAPDLSYWHPENVSNMRAALRAAGEVR